jgi:hypothetical protein
MTLPRVCRKPRIIAHAVTHDRALAVTTAMRAEALPDIPTLGEFVPGYEASFSDSALSRVDLLELWRWIRFKRPHYIKECNYDCMACIIKRLIAWKGCHCQSRNVLGLP